MTLKLLMKNMELILTFTAISSSFAAVSDADCTKDAPWNCRDDGAALLDFNRYSRIVMDQDNWDEIDHEVHESEIPENFDAREHWPECESVISRIRNQGPCSNCWSLCAAMVLADRVCIASKGNDKVEFSINDLNSCCSRCLKAPTEPPCKYGGTTFYAFQYAVDSGVAFESCKPFNYTQLCSAVPKCEKKCLDPRKRYRENVHKANLALISESKFTIDIREVQLEILKNGPICGQLVNITDEFKFWNQKDKSPKQHPPRPATAAHGIRIIGWGTQSGVDYWLCANSWGTSWGDKGFFKIRRGYNEFNMEEQFSTVLTRSLRYKPENSCVNLSKANLLVSTIFYFSFTVLSECYV